MNFNSKLLLCLSIFLFGSNFLYTAENKEIAEDPVFKILTYPKREGIPNIPVDYYKTVDDFINSQKDINMQNSEGKTPLIKAIEFETLLSKILRDLPSAENLQRNIGLERERALESHERTVNFYRTNRGNLLRTIDLLLKNGSNLKIKDNNGKTAIDYLTIAPKTFLTGRIVPGYFNEVVNKMIQQELKRREKRKEETKKVLEDKLIPALADIVCDYEC